MLPVVVAAPAALAAVSLHAAPACADGLFKTAPEVCMAEAKADRINNEANRRATLASCLADIATVNDINCLTTRPSGRSRSLAALR